jgi:hypothetical protein
MDYQRSMDHRLVNAALNHVITRNKVFIFPDYIKEQTVAHIMKFPEELQRVNPGCGSR